MTALEWLGDRVRVDREDEFVAQRSLARDGGVMAKRARRIPRYLRDDLARLMALDRDGIPSDAIPADPSQQAPNNSYGPPLFYRDLDFACVDCGLREVWTAEQQKWWYEVAKGSIYSGPKR